MIWYTIALAYIYFLIFKARQLPLFLLFLISQPLVFFATFRGGAGKDTELYLYRFYNSELEVFEFNLFSEPIISLLIKFSKIFSDKHEFFFFVHSSLIVFLFLMALKKYPAVRLYFVTIAPMFLIDGIMNGMRVTLAYHFFIVAVAYRKELFSIPLVFLSHVSGSIMYIAVFLTRTEGLLLYKKVLLYSLVLFVFITAYLNIDFILSFSERLDNKFSQYGELTLETSYSGLADISILLTVFVISALGNVRPRERFYFIFGGIVLSIFFFLAIQQSLVFIRVLKLFLVGLLVSEFLNTRVTDKKLNLAIFIGVLYTLNFLRQIYFGEGFLPYPDTI